jgi:hypothetical protein
LGGGKRENEGRLFQFRTQQYVAASYDRMKIGTSPLGHPPPFRLTRRALLSRNATVYDLSAIRREEKPS